MSEDKNPTPASLRATAKQVLDWLNDEKDADCPDALTGIGYPMNRKLADLLEDLCNAVLAEPPAVRCAGNEDALRVAASGLLTYLQHDEDGCPHWDGPDEKPCKCGLDEAKKKFYTAWKESAALAPVPQPPRASLPARVRGWDGDAKEHGRVLGHRALPHPRPRQAGG